MILCKAQAAVWPEFYAAAHNLRPEHLTQLGIATDDAVAAGGLGIAEISRHSGGLFELGGDLNALILPVIENPSLASRELRDMAWRNCREQFLVEVAR